MANAFTKSELVKMWKRPVERQYNVAVSKILEALKDTDGEIAICFSGGKDSSLLLDMFCEIYSQIDKYKGKPITVYFANTTNETKKMLQFIDFFVSWVQKQWGVKLDFKEVRPEKGLTWASFVKENGIPLISKEQAKYVRMVRRDVEKIGCDLSTLEKYHRGGMDAVNALFDMGFSKTAVLNLTGWVSSRQAFGEGFILSKVWLPMVFCPVPISEQCCVNIKEKPLHQFPNIVMTGEQAAESKTRENVYLKTGCNIRFDNGDYKSKPFGAMTLDGILFALQYRKTPICGDYGSIVRDNDGHYRCTKTNRTGCALCGFGCQYDTERFVRLTDEEPAKVKFAFTPREKGGAGYGEAIEYMNEYCGTKVQIPKLK